MTECGAPVAPGVDPNQLASAYADGAKLQARRNLYDHVVPYVDFTNWALDHLELTDDDRILDVGCGPGLALTRLSQRELPLDLVGIDRSTGMAKQAREVSAVAVATAEALPARSGAFDAVLAMHMLYHVPDIPAAVRELRRVLRPGGALVVSTLGPDHVGELRDVIGAAVAGERLPWPSRRFNLDNAAAQLELAFDSVVLHRRKAELVLTDPEPACAFVASTRDFYEPLLPPDITWDVLLERVASAVAG